MGSDPRCPACGEKVSATATWCMHCSADFDAPVDAERGGARMDSKTRTCAEDGSGSGGGGDSFGADDVDGTRATLTAAGLGVVAWIVLSAVVPLVGWADVIALAALVALVFHVRTLASPVDMLVRMGYATAGLVVGLRVYVAWATPGVAGSLNGWTLVVAGALVYGAHWADENRDEFDVSAFESA